MYCDYGNGGTRKRNERHRGHLRRFITIINNSLPLPIIISNKNIYIYFRWEYELLRLLNEIIDYNDRKFSPRLLIIVELIIISFNG